MPRRKQGQARQGRLCWREEAPTREPVGWAAHGSPASSGYCRTALLDIWLWGWLCAH